MKNSIYYGIFFLFISLIRLVFVHRLRVYIEIGESTFFPNPFYNRDIVYVNGVDGVDGGFGADSSMLFLLFFFFIFFFSYLKFCATFPFQNEIHFSVLILKWFQIFPVDCVESDRTVELYEISFEFWHSMTNQPLSLPWNCQNINTNIVLPSTGSRKPCSKYMFQGNWFKPTPKWRRIRRRRWRRWKKKFLI